MKKKDDRPSAKCDSSRARASQHPQSFANLSSWSNLWTYASRPPPSEHSIEDRNSSGRSNHVYAWAKVCFRTLPCSAQVALSIMGAIGCAIGGAHFFLPDGNMAAMGFTPEKFLPKKVAMPDEISLLINHMVGIYGAAALGYSAMCFLAAFVYTSREAKQITCASFLVWMVFGLITQFTKPAGTGVEGSPATGPIPLMILFIVLPSYAFMQA